TLARGSHPCGRRRGPCWRQPLAGALQPSPFAGVALAAVGRAHRRCPCGLLPLRIATPASGVGLPCGLGMAAIGRPPVGGLGHGLVVGGRPCMGAGRGWSRLLQAAFTAKT
ncbi:hypothetical protein BHM03_00021236, partial [Ensete ventricosum]